MAYADSLSNSFGGKVIGDILALESTGAFKQESVPRALPKVDQTLEGIFKNGANGLDSPESLGLVQPAEITPPPTPPAPAWTFITAPENVDWDIANNAQRIDIFGTNNPPVVAGSRGMRDLTLSNALVEGFMRNVSVEGKIAALENLLNYNLNSSDGFVSVPVYQLWASKKRYGGAQGFFIIKDVKVKEAMRDLKGNTTRAYVDISLMQVPAYQVNSGRDQASAVTAGAKSGLISDAQTRAVQQAQAANGGKPTGAGGGNLGAGQSGPKDGAGVPQDKPKPVTAEDPTTGRQVGVSRVDRE